MRLSFFKLQKAKPFEYKPLYYDPQKDPDNKEYNKTSELNSDYRSRMKAEMHEKWAIGRNRAKQPRGFINRRNLLIYFIVALMLLYFILM